jgi:hypothetical protein
VNLNFPIALTNYLPLKFGLRDPRYTLLYGRCSRLSVAGWRSSSPVCRSYSSKKIVKHELGESKNS